MQETQGWIVSLDDEANLGLCNRHGICVIQHRVDRMSGSSVVATSVSS